MIMAEVAEHTAGRFYGVYLLCSESIEKRFKGKCYVGFTVNPNRRINQHNKGKDYGGARKTSNKGPWKMVMIVHGFPNNISALQFEWAWQQPTLSTRLKNFIDLKRKIPKESFFQYHFRILSRMLTIGPWKRLPLTIRWLEPEYQCDFDIFIRPPDHMQIVTGPLKIVKETKKSMQNQPKAIWAPECHLCMKIIEHPERSRIGCLNNLCKLTCHLICFANHLISSDETQKGHYIPINGECPLCETKVTWAALLMKKQKMEGINTEENYSQEEDEDEEDDFDNSDGDEDIICLSSPDIN